jgi:hypothetical protein
MNKTIVFVVAIVIAIGLLGFTSPGHRVLNALGFATAGCSGSGC